MNIYASGISTGRTYLSHCIVLRAREDAKGREGHGALFLINVRYPTLVWSGRIVWISRRAIDKGF